MQCAHDLCCCKHTKSNAEVSSITVGHQFLCISLLTGSTKSNVHRGKIWDNRNNWSYDLFTNLISSWLLFVIKSTKIVPTTIWKPSDCNNYCWVHWIHYLWSRSTLIDSRMARVSSVLVDWRTCISGCRCRSRTAFCRENRVSINVGMI